MVWPETFFYQCEDKVDTITLCQHYMATLGPSAPHNSPDFQWTCQWKCVKPGVDKAQLLIRKEPSKGLVSWAGQWKSWMGWDRWDGWIIPLRITPFEKCSLYLGISLFGGGGGGGRQSVINVCLDGLLHFFCRSLRIMFLQFQNYYKF